MNILRLATPHDIEAIFNIRTSVTENHLSLAQLSNMGITADSILTLMQSRPCIWVVENQQGIAGFSIADFEEGSIFATFFDPKFQGLGLGKMLLIKAEHALFEQYSSIWLETDQKSKAYTFYKNLGWNPIEFFSNGDVKMTKTSKYALN